MARWLILALFCGLLFAPLKAAEDTPNAAEAKQAADEEAAEKKIEAERDRPVVHSAKGKLMLKKGGDLKAELKKNPNAVIGTVSGKEREYQLRLLDASHFDRVAKLDGKLVELSGKIRNGGKYFIAQAVYEVTK